jgi:hypothetical protein
MTPASLIAAAALIMPPGSAPRLTSRYRLGPAPAAADPIVRIAATIANSHNFFIAQSLSAERVHGLIMLCFSQPERLQESVHSRQLRKIRRKTLRANSTAAILAFDPVPSRAVFSLRFSPSHVDPR